MDYDALPVNGGLEPAQQTPPVVEPEIRQIGGEAGGTFDNAQFNGGRWYSSINQFGDFAVGDTFTVEQKTGAINFDPAAVTVNIVQDQTPNLGGDLGVNGFRIIGGNNAASPEDGDIVLAVDANHTFIADSETAFQLLLVQLLNVLNLVPLLKLKVKSVSILLIIPLKALMVLTGVR